MTNEEIRLRVRLNALARAYIRGDEIVKGQAMTQEEILTEIRSIKAMLDKVNKQDPIEAE